MNGGEGPHLFKIQGWLESTGSWEDVFVRTYENGWRTQSRAVNSLLEDVLYFNNIKAYPRYRLIEVSRSGSERLEFSTLDLFYVDPAGVDVVHYESKYSTPMPRFTDTFTDRSTVPRNLSYTGYTMTTALTSVIAFPQESSPITPSGDFTVMIPIRIPFNSFTSDERLDISALNVYTRLRYVSNTLVLLGAESFTGALPDKASKWYNNYHVVSVVYTASTNKAKTYLHYYTTDSNVVSSISSQDVTIGSYSRQELKFIASEMTGNINIRPATMFPSALSETVLTAAAKKILKYEEIVYYSFVISQKSSGVGGGNNLPGSIEISGMGWNLTPVLNETNIVRYIPSTNGGGLSRLFDNDNNTTFNNNNSYNIGDEFFYIAAPKSVSTFTITFWRPIYRPGFKIYKNGVLVYTDASVATSAIDPSPNPVTYNV